jgi:hypothetical protein
MDSSEFDIFLQIRIIQLSPTIKAALVVLIDW